MLSRFLRKRPPGAFRFRCASCDDWHEGVPAIGSPAPMYWMGLSPDDRARRAVLTSDTCIVDGAHYFIRGCLDIPVQGSDEPFSIGAWVSLSASNFATFDKLFDQPRRSGHGPWFGWFQTWPHGYPDCENLKSRVHLRDDGLRPLIELEPTDHPLAVDQRNGISPERLAELVAPYLHPAPDGAG